LSATAIIDRVFPYASGFGRTGTRSILSLIERAQDRLFEYDGDFMRYIDPTDNKGFPPYLLTTAGTYKYNLIAANLSCGALVKNIGGTDYTVRARKPLKVFRDVSKSDYGINRWVGRPFVYAEQNPYSTSIERSLMAEVQTNKYPALEGTAAYIEFLEDPGTTTTSYFCEFLFEAPRLDSESVPLSVPLAYEEALEDFVMGRIQWLTHGKPNEFMNRFEEYWLPKFRSECATSGRSMNALDTPARPC